ncbi:MAG: hypothetical protein M3P11_04595 [Actinomycetota bacterium]|nr:hypothetical protein [Actinomycetota bacterium]
MASFASRAIVVAELASSALVGGLGLEHAFAASSSASPSASHSTSSSSSSTNSSSSTSKTHHCPNDG